MSSTSESVKTKPLVVGFYNVENLFDTFDDPNTNDDAFTPGSEKAWDEERFEDKNNKLGNVIDSFCQDNTLLALGVSEVENEYVLKALVDEIHKHENVLGIVHEESPDHRGIDVGFLYNKELLEVIDEDFIRVDYSDLDDEYLGRDILHVTTTFVSGDTIHFFVNHWPSRRDGLEESEPKRLRIAKHLREEIDFVYHKNPDAHIIVLGDFNDEPHNKSVVEELYAAKYSDIIDKHQLVNLTADMAEEGKGTYNYQGNWNMLDQIMVSQSLVNGKASIRTSVDQTDIFFEKWILYDSKSKGLTPNKTYGGPNYYGGYSDHLPVFTIFNWND